MICLRFCLLMLAFGFSYAQIDAWSGEIFFASDYAPYDGPPVTLNVIFDSGVPFGRGQLETGGSFRIDFDEVSVKEQLRPVLSVFSCPGKFDPEMRLLDVVAINVANPETGENYGTVETRISIEQGAGLTSIQYSEQAGAIEMSCSKKDTSIDLRLQPGWNLAERVPIENDRFYMRSIPLDTPLYWYFSPSELWLDRYTVQ